MKKICLAFGLIVALSAPAKEVLIAYPHDTTKSWQECYNSLAQQALVSLGLERYQLVTTPSWHYSLYPLSHLIAGGNTIAKWKAPSDRDENDFISIFMRVRGGTPKGDSGSYLCITWFPAGLIAENFQTALQIKNARGRVIAESIDYVNEKPGAPFNLDNYKLKIRVAD